jgi:serine phosphatase RsbU (regulator of sigma subunit)/anti-sigma regulatory factor (Ser/Thr protein kinase)
MHSVMAVALRARGTTFGVAVFIRHQRQEPFTEDDLLLAEEITGRAAVFIDNARRYTHERDTATALQKTLLPQQLPRRQAVEVAYRYLPASALAGVGGDWFDVIPLSSARVALVVGDVVGHGIQAAAAMGRLRTAVRTLADVDLSPDELLTHLDDLVVRLAADADTGGASPTDQAAETAGGFGATCLYAVYDPVSQTCALASAGHPMPALVTPEGTVDILDAPVGPPLGLGGLPFEATEVTLPEGSILALHTDGLISSRHLDIDQGLARLRKALAHPAADLDVLCDTLLGTLPPEDRTDDIALLIARTHALGARHVASWDLPADPAIVAQARRLVAAQLVAWDLTEASFVTELVISELVTNAIRHAAPPIQLRLIHDRHLICEVSDASNTAPHLRRAHTYDEGGRGLLLVAQLTRGWGTRHADSGKTIWAELDLDVLQPGI